MTGSSRGERCLRIVGAGPAGLVAAIAARRVGLRAVVHEAAAGPRSGGGGVFLHSNGLRVLHTLGLWQGLSPQVATSQLITVELPDGRRLSTFDYRRLDIPCNHGGVVLRQDLQEHLLASAREAGAEIRFGEGLDGLEQNADEVRLRLASGAEVSAWAALGCDGVGSPTRRALGLPGEPRALGEAYLRGVSRTAARQDAAREIWGRDGRRFGICPLPAGRTYFYASVPLGGWEEIRRLRLAEWLASWAPLGEEVKEILAGVEDWNEAHYDELVEMEAGGWYRGRVFLAGDAAHTLVPNLGQGVSSAMVDSLVLVRLLAGARSESLETLGRTYERLRRPFVGRIQRASRRLGRIARDPHAREVFVRQALEKPPPPASAGPDGEVLAAGYNPRENEYFEDLPSAG
jgi:2-polyprenyl-6-methoxyphenol hydroxylase-like FAD-dependent oxidoreductase